MTELTHALTALADVFERLDVTYVVIGGVAVRAYAIPRPTYDVDFTLAAPRERLPEIFAAVEEKQFTVPDAYRTGWVDVVAELPLVKFRFYLKDRGVDADIFLAETPFQKEMLTRRQLVETPDGRLWLASPEDIIVLKLLAHRPRDLLDVGDILFTQGQLDEDYMRKWAGQLNILPRLEKTLAEAKAQEF